MRLENVTVQWPRAAVNYELADVSFNVSYNLTNTFKWTVKELYLSLVAVWDDSVGR